ncbi:MAG: four helix bundle protein [Bacteroidetes bacterium]|nr:four helix bundle protein [Bacteroidota bacterium]
MHNYKQLKIWQKRIDLVVAVSISSNIVEGAGRNSAKEFNHFLTIAHGSSYELETQVIFSEKLRLIEKELSDDLCAKINEV